MHPLANFSVSYSQSFINAVAQNLHHHVRHELRNRLLGKFFLLQKAELMKKSQSCTNASMSHEDFLIPFG